MSEADDFSLDTSEITPGEEIDTVNDLVDIERMRQILRRRERVSEILEKGDALRVAYPDASKTDIDLLLENRVRAFALELGPMMRQSHHRGYVEIDYWNGYPKLEADIGPPSISASIIENPDGSRTDIPEPETIKGYGVGTIVDKQSPISLQWRARNESPYVNSKWETVTRQWILPRKIPLDILQACDEFLREMGFDVSIEGGEIDDYGRDREPF